ncbi:MAG: shikimate kinase [Candidatus Hydrothermarchaeales archaeon]
MKNIVLTGFMGSGKSAVGKRLAQRLGTKVIDTDDLIEERACTSITSIFSEHGEKHFRELEKSVVKDVSQLDNRVIITGGGVVLDPENIENLKRNGVIVYLPVEPDVAYERVKRRTHRPLLQVEDPLKTIKELMEYRAQFYANNDYEIDTFKLTVDEVVENILRDVKPFIGD